MSKFSAVLKSKVAKNGFWMILLQGFNTIIPLITLPYITRILSKSIYGEFSVSLNWIGYFQVVVEYGFGLTGARRAALNRKKEDLNNVHSSIICARLILLVLCIVIFGTVILLINVAKTQIICMLILFFMVFSIAFQQNWFFQGIAEMKNIAIINVVSRSISVILIFLLVKSPNDLYLYCVLYVSNYFISTLFGLIIVRRRYKIRFIKPSLKIICKELVEGWPLFISLAMTKIFANIGITILDVISTKESVGVYSAISKIPYVLSLLFAAIAQAIYPFMCNSFSLSFKSGLMKARKYAVPILAFFALGGMVIIFANKKIVHIVFGSDYTECSTLLIPFVIWVLFGIINNFLGVQVLVASGHQKEYSKAFSVSVIIMIGLMLILGKLYEAYGIAYASMFSEMMLTLLLIYFIKKITKADERKEL